MRHRSIGIFTLSESFEKHANRLHKDGEFDESEIYFKMSINICETPDNITGYADLLDDMNLFKKSVEYYEKAIKDYNCSIAMHNLGITLMEKYGKQINDNNENHENDYLSKLNNYYISALKSFDLSIENENSKYKRYENIIDCIYHGLDYVSRYINEVSSINIYNNDKTALGLYSIIQTMKNIIDDCQSTEILLNTSLILDKWTLILKEFNDFRVYENKIKLFERLNNIETCNICYDDKLNIDLNCGHTVCKDCYVKLYLAKCPFCRIKCVTDYNSFDIFDYINED